MQFLASTNRGLEQSAATELQRLVGASAETHHPGMVRFEAPPTAVYRLHQEARTIHRVLVVRANGKCRSIRDIDALARDLDVSEIFTPDTAFAVRAQRHGEHSFGSPDVEEVVGQAIVDQYRETAGRRPPVDLDDPGVVFRVLVRHDRVVIAVDATGQRSLHRRWYRRHEHDAALRPTLAACMLQLADFEGESRLVDPMCGAGTIPIEAALIAHDRFPTPAHEPAFRELRFLNDVCPLETGLDQSSQAGDGPEIVGLDHSADWTDAARENASVAGVDGVVNFKATDATEYQFEGGVLVTDLPFGIRTDDRNIAGLYHSFFDAIERVSWNRLVLLTTRDDLIPYEPTATYDIRRGMIEASIIVVE